jgi:hypothetical protein
MQLSKFITAHNLKPADAIMLRKKFMGMVDHYVVYVGVIENRHRFVANHKSGVSFVSEGELRQYVTILEPQRIERFEGDESERSEALKRAFSAIGQPYHLIRSNCEHFKEWVQRGQWRSQQVSDAGTGTALTGAALAIGGLAAKNGKVAGAGLGLLALGLILKSFSDEDE